MPARHAPLSIKTNLNPNPNPSAPNTNAPYSKRPPPAKLSAPVIEEVARAPTPAAAAQPASVVPTRTSSRRQMLKALAESSKMSVAGGLDEKEEDVMMMDVDVEQGSSRRRRHEGSGMSTPSSEASSSGVDDDDGDDDSGSEDEVEEEYVPNGKASSNRRVGSRIRSLVGPSPMGFPAEPANSDRGTPFNSAPFDLPADVKPSKLGAGSRKRGARTSALPDDDLEVMDQDDDQDAEPEPEEPPEPICWTCYYNKPIGRGVSHRGYDEQDQPYRQLSREMSKFLPDLPPCRTCLPEEGPTKGGKVPLRASNRRRGAPFTSEIASPTADNKDKGPASLCLNDVEAALILTYLERDERLLSEYQAGDHKGKYMFLADKEEFSQLMVERALAEKGIIEQGTLTGIGKGAIGGVGGLGMTVKRKNGVVRVLSKGVCGNCGMDENGAIMWRTDPVVKEQFGLRRKLCNKCGLYKQTNLVDRPILHPWTQTGSGSGSPVTGSNPLGSNSSPSTPAFTTSRLSSVLGSHPLGMAPPLTTVPQAARQPRQEVASGGGRYERKRRSSMGSVLSQSSAANEMQAPRPRKIRKDKGIKRKTFEEVKAGGMPSVLVQTPQGLVVQTNGVQMAPTFIQANGQAIQQQFVMIPAMTPVTGTTMANGQMSFQWTQAGQYQQPPGFYITGQGNNGFMEAQILSPPPSQSSHERV